MDKIITLPRLLTLFFIASFYFFISTNGTFSYNLNQHTHYNTLADSFLNGKLALPYKVPEGLLALKNPYDPIANKPFRWGGFHDLSLYKEKFYLYFGPSAIVTAYIPFKLFTGKRLPDNLAIFIFTTGSLILGSLIIFSLKKKYFQNIPEWIILLSICVFGFSNVSPFLLSSPYPYEVAISSATFYLLGSIFFLMTALTKENNNTKYFLLGGIFLGLVPGGRFYFTFACLILILFLLKKTAAPNIFNSLSNSQAKAIIISFFICLFLMFIYNYLRFGNFLENGSKYLLTYFPPKLIDIQSVIPNSYSHIFQPIVIKSNFPFIYTEYWKPYFVPGYLGEGAEKICGFIFSAPFVLFIFLIFLVNKNLKGLPFEFWLFLLPGGTNLILLLMFQYVTMRYKADYLSLLILSACVAYFYYDSNFIGEKKARIITRFIFIFASIYSILCGIAIGINGHVLGLKDTNPLLFKKLEMFFN